MTSIKAFAARFARLRSILGTIETSEAAQSYLREANENFNEMYETWLVLLPEDQQEVHTEFEQAQRDFHVIGGQLLDKVNPPLMFGEFPKDKTGENLPIESLVTKLSETGTVAPQSENPNAGNPHESMDFTDGAQNKAVIQPSKLQPSPNEMTINAAIEQSGVMVSDAITLEQLAHGIKNAVATAFTKPEKVVWDETRPLQDLNFSTYKEQWELMAPIFSLSQQDSLSEEAINMVIETIDGVGKNFDTNGFACSQQTKRMMLMHIASILDSQTQTCWKYRLTTDDPTVEGFINFLIERKADAPPKKFKIPKLTPSVKTVPKSEVAGTSTGRSRSRSTTKGGTVDKRCALCSRQHVLKECNIFRKLSFERREIEVTRRSLCKRCFSNAHPTGHCNKAACQKCGKKHNDLLVCR